LTLPSELTLLNQAFSANGFRLVESRLNYFYDAVKSFTHKERYATRLAQTEDADILRSVARKMVNIYDRFHSDSLIDNKNASDYLGQYAYNNVMGFSDFVIVPDIKDEETFGFLSSNRPVELQGLKIAKLTLAAIDNSRHRGWLFKLLIESIYMLKELDVDYLTTITQTSNMPAFNTWQKMGFKLGFTTNIFSLMNND
jgi:dTDP-4-amino-4,6-dideoxy-D-galactose acyltransferase